MLTSIPKNTKRIGILGGTFDPVHRGHLAAAKAALLELALDVVLFIPSCRPPHKISNSVLSFSHRSAMLDLALVENEKFMASYVEAKRGGPSYTCDTLADLRRILDPDIKLFFITGIDAFYEVYTWENYLDLPNYADFAILGRPPYCQKRLAAYIKKVFPGYPFVEPCKFHFVSMTPVDISSTIIRDRASVKLPIAHLTPPEVAQYIQQEGLYRL